MLDFVGLARLGKGCNERADTEAVRDGEWDGELQKKSDASATMQLRNAATTCFRYTWSAQALIDSVDKYDIIGKDGQ